MELCLEHTSVQLDILPYEILVLVNMVEENKALNRIKVRTRFCVQFCLELYFLNNGNGHCS